MKTNAAVRALLDIAHALAMREVEARARKILGSRNGAKSFCMAMGGVSFYDSNGNPMDPDLKYLQSFYKFVEEFDDELKLTGTPLKLESSAGEVITDW